MEGSLSSRWAELLPTLRYEPTLKRIRARLGDTTVVDSTRAVLLWEPTRVVPTYAVPSADVLVPARPDPPDPERPDPGAGGAGGVGFGADPPVLDPSVPFHVHTTPGQPVALAAGGRGGAAFRLAGGVLDGYLALDFDGFDWVEEEEPIVGHPRDPFHRIDVRESRRHVRLTAGGVLLADSGRPRMLFEGTFPMPRYYLPRADVAVRLVPSGTRTVCAYKGTATHYTALLEDRRLEDVAWSYEQPLSDARDVGGLICFYHERFDLSLDGEPVPPLRTPWS